MTPAELDVWLDEQRIETVRLVILDMHGVPRAKRSTCRTA